MTEKRAAVEDKGLVRVAALALMLVPVLQILAMAHHPSLHAHDASQVVSQLRTTAPLSALVHGVLIAFMYVILLAFTEFSVRRGLSQPAVRAALILYGAGVIFMTAAALVSGFIVSRLGFVIPGAVPTDDTLIVKLVTFASLFNQAFAHCAAVLMSAGIAAWSLELLRGSGAARVLGGYGLLSAIGCALALIFGVLQLDVHGMTVVVLLQSAWTIGVGVLLLRGA